MKGATQRQSDIERTEEPITLAPDAAVILKERLHRKDKEKEQKEEEEELHLFKNIPFLILVSLTIMNAFLYVYLAMNNFAAIEERAADALIRESFGKDYAYFSPIYEFLAETKTTGDLDFPSFKKSLTKLSSNINSFGIPTRGVFARQSFHFSRGGIYWTRPMIEGRTVYRPRVRSLDKEGAE